MKQSAAKTLGVAVIGAALAAAAAGTASAAPAVGVADALNTVTGVAGPLGNTLNHAQASEDGVQQSSSDASDPVQGLLGGLPAAGGLLNGGA
ncbi:hypothetical protein [Streptomyces sp. NPDC093225]|uniref:hypothetical protein n=1 Tax=Streptomyces sp. NPDC093225 TaxID=3366034 RepID=UPI00381D5049